MKRPKITGGSFLLLLVFSWMAFLSAGLRAEAATESEITVFYFCTDEMGLNPAAACGIMSNISAESGFQPEIVGPGGAYGICQWMGGRKTRLQSWCSSNGYSYNTLKGQLNYLYYELKTFYPNVETYLKSVENTAAGAYNAGYHWCYYFEAPSNIVATSSSRGSKAQSVYWPDLGTNGCYASAASVTGGVKLSWNKSGSYGYQILRAVKADGKYKKIAVLNKSRVSFTDSTVTKGKTYYYYVEPLSKDGSAAGRSNRVSCTVKKTLKDSECSIKFSKVTFTYSGSAKTPQVKVTYDGNVLTSGKDYSVEYSSNVNAGTAYVTVSGKGDYGGTRKFRFTINKAKPIITFASVKTQADTPVVLNAETSGDGSLSYVIEDQTIAEVKSGKLKPKKPGLTSITVKAKETSNYAQATKKVTLTVLPAKGTLKAVKVLSKTSVRVRWTRADDVCSYQLQYIQGNQFSGKPKTLRISLAKAKTATVRIKGLKEGQTYSFRIRAVLNAGGKKLLGKWSEIKTVIL